MYKGQETSPVLELASDRDSYVRLFIPKQLKIASLDPGFQTSLKMCFTYTTTTKYAKAPCTDACTIVKTDTEICQDVREGRPCKGTETSVAGATTKRGNCPKHVW
jgi:hypothetical protein